MLNQRRCSFSGALLSSAARCATWQTGSDLSCVDILSAGEVYWKEATFKIGVFETKKVENEIIKNSVSLKKTNVNLSFWSIYHLYSVMSDE